MGMKLALPFFITCIVLSSASFSIFWPPRSHSERPDYPSTATLDFRLVNLNTVSIGRRSNIWRL